MPIFESVCSSDACSMFGVPVEHYYHTADAEMVLCGRCGGTTQKILSNFRVVFTGAISARYNDRGKENSHQEGHWAYRTKTVNGRPEPVFIDTWDKQRAFCKSEGIANPSEMPRNFQVGEDGKKVLNTRGLPGTEI